MGLNNSIDSAKTAHTEVNMSRFDFDVNLIVAALVNKLGGQVTITGLDLAKVHNDIEVEAQRNGVNIELRNRKINYENYIQD